MSEDGTQASGQSFPPDCSDAPSVLLIHHLGVAFSSIDLSTWNLANAWEREKKRWQKLRQMENCFWSKLLNIPFSFNKRTSQVIRRPGLLSWKSCFAYRSQSCQTTAMAPTRKSMPFPPPLGSGGASKSVCFLAGLINLSASASHSLLPTYAS